MKNKSFLISIIISVFSIIITLVINIKIANEYAQSDGKTKALFGLREFLQFSYQYYVCTLGLTAIFFSFKAGYKSARNIFSLLLAICSIVFVFVGLWRILV